MAHYLLLGTASETWRLHHDTDPNEVRTKLDQAFAEETTTTVQIVPADQIEPAPLTVNPRQLGWWAVVERSETIHF